MAGVLQWRKQNALTQVQASALLGVSQPYLSLLEKGERPLTPNLRSRLRTLRHGNNSELNDEVLRARLSKLGYPGFAHLPKSRGRVHPDALLISVLARPDVDARIVEALPWLVRSHAGQLDFPRLVRDAKLQNLQNRLGFVLDVAAANTSAAEAAIRNLEHARLLAEDTLCWNSMPAPTRNWMRAQRSPRAAHWNILTRMDCEDAGNAKSSQ